MRFFRVLCFSFLFIAVLSAKSVVQPQHISAAGQDISLSVFTYNVLESFSDNDGKCSESNRVRAIAQYLTENNVQIVFLQETGCVEVLKKLWEKSSGATIDSIESHYINKKLAILSKLPMERDSNGSIKQADSAVYAGDRKTQSVRVLVGNQYVRLFNVHPHNFCSEQNNILQFMHLFSGENVPQIIAGDFNSTSLALQTCLADIDTLFVRTCQVPGSCPSSSSSSRPNPIDQIFATRSRGSYMGEIVTHRVLNGLATFDNVSDHWPVEANIRFVSQQPPTPTLAPTLPSRGDFNKDGMISILDYALLTRALHTTNASLNLTGSDTFIDLYDYNEFLKLL